MRVRKSSGPSPVMSYVVRVYGRDPVSQELVGIVEIPERDVRTAFHGFDELKAILSGYESLRSESEKLKSKRE
jgi:hypothetical protein